MKREEDEQLWDLLGKAGGPPLSPFFARDVLRQIRQEPSWRDKLAWWFAPPRVLAAGAVAAAIVVATISLPRLAGTAPSAANTQQPTVQLEPIDYQVVVDLDILLAMEDDDLWTDDEMSTL